MGKKDVVDSKKINSCFTKIEHAMFVIIVINFLLKNLGYWNIVNWIIIGEQVALSLYLLYLLIIDIPNYHDSNKTTDKIDYQNSVSLFLQLDLAKIFERIVTLTTLNVLFFLSKNDVLSVPFNYIAIGMSIVNIFIWLSLKYIESKGIKNLRRFKFIYFLLFFMLVLEACNLVFPLFLLINILPYWLLGIIVLFCYGGGILFAIWKVKRKNKKK